MRYSDTEIPRYSSAKLIDQKDAERWLLLPLSQSQVKRPLTVKLRAAPGPITQLRVIDLAKRAKKFTKRREKTGVHNSECRPESAKIICSSNSYGFWLGIWEMGVSRKVLPSSLLQNWPTYLYSGSQKSQQIHLYLSVSGYLCALCFLLFIHYNFISSALCVISKRMGGFALSVDINELIWIGCGHLDGQIS